MKHHMRRVFPVCLSILMAINIFIYNSLTVYALPKRLLDGTWIDVPLSEYGEEVSYFIQYAVNQMGAVFTRDFETWLKNNDAYKDLYDDNGRLAKNISIDTQTGTVTYNKEIMIVLKNAADDYAKQEQTKEENGGFYLLPTTDFDDLPISVFKNSYKYKTFRNIVMEKGVIAVKLNYQSNLNLYCDPFCNSNHPILLVGTLSSIDAYEKNPDLRVSFNYFCAECWEYHKFKVMEFPDDNKEYESLSEAEHFNTGDIGYSQGGGINAGVGNLNNFNLYSTTGERIRVFVSQTAAKEYSIGKRNVYFTKEYYNYVPEDLTVSVDDLQKSVDDLQSVIDKLLQQISNDTSEKDIEELLQQILDELRKNPGGGGGGGSSSGGDVTVSVDLKETNNLLFKIYNKVSEIYVRLSESVENAGQTALDGIQTSLDEISETLKKIKGWTIADTIIDGADAVADWADFIKDLFSDVTSGVSAVSSTMSDAAELMQTKFPFCLPWDVELLVTFLAHEPQTPVFQLPIIIENFGIEEYIEIDMTRFSALSTISRTILSLIYFYGLINLTFKIIPMVKEEN